MECGGFVRCNDRACVTWPNRHTVGNMRYELDGKTFQTDVRFCELPETSTATKLAYFSRVPG